jgi:hypothetical protein
MLSNRPVGFRCFQSVRDSFINPQRPPSASITGRNHEPTIIYLRTCYVQLNNARWHVTNKRAGIQTFLNCKVISCLGRICIYNITCYNNLLKPITLVQPFRRRLCVLDRIRTQFFHDDSKHTNRATSALLLLTPSFRASLSTIIITIHTLVVILAIRLQTSTITTLCSFLIRTMRMSRVLLR